jgi:hypothetical protein
LFCNSFFVSQYRKIKANDSPTKPQTPPIMQRRMYRGGKVPLPGNGGDDAAPPEGG